MRNRSRSRGLTVIELCCIVAVVSIAWLVFGAGPSWGWSGGTNIVCQNGACSITGQVAVANGGTGVATLTDRAVVIGRGTAAVEGAAPGNAGSVLRSTGASTNPAFGAVDLADSDAVTGTLPLGNGGTGASSWTANRCVRVNAGGTALEVASGDCGTPLPPVIFMSTLGEVTAGTTMHIGPSTADASQARAQVIAPTAMSIDNTRCCASVAPGTGESFTITMADGACTGALSDSAAQVVTISDTARCGQESGAAEAVSAGNCYAFKVVPSAAAATAVVTCGAERSA